MSEECQCPPPYADCTHPPAGPAPDAWDAALTDDEWRAFQAIPDQGYSHRGWVDARIAERLAARDAATAERAWDEGSQAEMDASRWNKPRNPYRAARIARGEGR